ncbi:ATP-dependent RNA helicase, partial [Skeletonema marinoi]
TTNAFAPSPFTTTATQQRLTTTTSLNAAPSKTREEELASLAQRLEITPTKVRELLFSQRQKLKENDPKARRIDWLLDGAKDVVEKRKRQSEPTSGVVKRDSAPAVVKKTKQPAATKKPPTTKTSTSTTTTKNNDASLLSNISFAQRTDLHPATKRALTETLGLTTMTDIQAKTYAAALSGKDVLGRARTGTGKTIAFLLPAIERLLRTPDYDEESMIGVVVISPTRELASQIGDEADKLLSFHRDMSTQVVFGGTKTTRDISRLKAKLPTVLVATPGRLKDLLQTASVRGKKFASIMKQTPIVVLDETDQLLDMGFRREIQQILNYMGSAKKRQTLLFSATVPPALKEIMRQTMQDDYVEVDCIKDGDKNGEASAETHIHIEQSHAIIPSMAQYVPSIIRVVQEAAADNGGGNKVVVFFPTARMVSFFADLFNEVVRLPVMELHSKKSQGYRNRVSGQFREAKTGILFTSDVSARGVDYPGVSHVVQLGMPSSREQYIHRLGRTGRAGASGKGWLLLGPFESLFLEELTKITIPKNPELIDLLNKDTLDETDDVMQRLMERVQNGDQVLNKSGEGAYQAFLGYYLGQMKRMRMQRKERLVEIANEFSASMGFRNAPALGANMVKKMGLAGIDGIFVTKKAKVNSNVPPKKDGRTRPKKERWQRK